MREKPTEGYEKRLSEALREGPRPMSVRALGREMEARYPDLRGATYGGIRLYVEGEVANPRVELLRAISSILNLRPEWLAFGKGEMTEEAQRIADAEAGALPRLALADVLSERLPQFGTLPPVVQSAVVHTSLRWIASEHPRFDSPVGDPVDARAVEAAAAVLDALSAPMVAWGIELDALEEDHLTDYSMAMLHALALSTPSGSEIPPDDEWTPGPGGERDWSDHPQLQEINRRFRDPKHSQTEENDDAD